MNEKRESRYSFTSQGDLTAFFSDTLPKKVIKETIRSLSKKFVKRPEVSWTVNRLQFLKKCEWELVRLSEKTIVESGEEDA